MHMKTKIVVEPNQPHLSPEKEDHCWAEGFRIVVQKTNLLHLIQVAAKILVAVDDRLFVGEFIDGAYDVELENNNTIVVKVKSASDLVCKLPGRMQDAWRGVVDDVNLISRFATKESKLFRPSDWWSAMPIGGVAKLQKSIRLIRAVHEAKATVIIEGKPLLFPTPPSDLLKLTTDHHKIITKLVSVNFWQRTGTIEDKTTDGKDVPLSFEQVSETMIQHLFECRHRIEINVQYVIDLLSSRIGQRTRCIILDNPDDY